MPNGVPNGPADIATFGLSHTTDVSISADTEVHGSRIMKKKRQRFCPKVVRKQTFSFGSKRDFS
jgi:hypothetical protein